MFSSIPAINSGLTTAIQSVGEAAREGVQAAGAVQPAAQPQAVQQPAPAVQQPGQANTADRTTAARGIQKQSGEERQNTRGSENGASRSGDQAENKNNSGLSKQEQALVDELVKTDRQVRTHEQAHISAGGNLVRGGPSFEYRSGPDGKRYAVGGEVSIDTTPVNGDPGATVRKAQHVRRAALAPADPSAQDLRVAAEATHMELQAQSEKTQMEKESQSGNTTQASGGGTKAAANAETQKESSPVLEAMMQKAYETALGKSPNTATNPVLNPFTA